MISPILYAPSNTAKEWIKFNAKLFKSKDELPFSPENYVTLAQISLPILKTNKFTCLSMVRDRFWLTSMALFYDKTIPLYHVKFCDIIERYLTKEIEKHIKGILSENMPYYKLIPQLTHAINENKQTKDRINAKLCKVKLIELVNNIRGSSVGPCMRCINNDTLNLKITSCCGNVCHQECWGAKIIRNCYECGKAGNLCEDINDIGRIFFKEKEFAERITGLKNLKEQREKEEKEEFEKKFISKSDKEIEDLIKKREENKKK